MQEFVFLVQTYQQMEPSAAPFAVMFASFGFIWIFACLIMIVSYGVLFAISYIVYRDAKKNNIDNPILWGLLTFFTGLIGIVLYFLIGKNQNKL